MGLHEYANFLEISQCNYDGCVAMTLAVNYMYKTTKFVIT